MDVPGHGLHQRLQRVAGGGGHLGWVPLCTGAGGARDRAVDRLRGTGPQGTAQRCWWDEAATAEQCGSGRRIRRLQMRLAGVCGVEGASGGKGMGWGSPSPAPPPAHHWGKGAWRAHIGGTAPRRRHPAPFWDFGLPVATPATTRRGPIHVAQRS